MKVIIYSLLAVISFSGSTISAAESDKGNQLIFEGQVLAIGPSPGYGSGGVQAYQLVKYRVIHVCKGKYSENEILVDHLLLDPDELKDLKVGDNVCVGVTKKKDMSSRWNDDVLRHVSDKVDVYYVALEVFIRNCRCSRPEPSNTIH